MSNNLNQGASIEAERAAFETWACGPTNDWSSGDMSRNSYDAYKDCDVQGQWELWQAARRTPAAATGDGELPPLPESQANGDNTADFFGRLFKHTDEDMREYGLACFTKGRAQNAEVDDLAMLVRQLVHSLRKAKPNSDLAARAADYLKRKGLAGSPLRSAEASAQPAQRESAAEGWVRVPVEPTTEMLEAIEDAAKAECSVEYDSCLGGNLHFGDPEQVYRAMLAASPAAQPAKDEQILGMRVVVDPTMPPNTMRIVSGENSVTAINVGSANNSADKQKGGAE